MIRKLLALACGAALVALAGQAAHAQGYPNKPIKIISAYAPGGGSEIGLRILAQKLGELGWPPVLVENRPGGGGGVAAAATMQSAADGYTLFQNDATSMAINVTLIPDLGYKPLEDFTPITVTWSFPSVLIVPASSPAKTVADLIALGKSKPRGLFYASQGIGSGGHLLGQMFSEAVKMPMTHTPYKGSGQAMPDVIAGRVDFIYSSLGSAKAHMAAGTLRAIAVTSKQRMKELPDLPTMTEAGYPSVFFDIWFGLAGPKGMPADVVKAINEKVVSTLKLPDVEQKINALGMYITTSTPDGYRDLIRTDTERLGKLVKASNVN